MHSQTIDDLLGEAVKRLPLPCDESVQKRAVRLGDGGIWSAQPAHDRTRLHCASGTIWVTQAGAAGDVVLRAGETFTARTGGGKVVVQALDVATFWVD